ncbi:RNA polymerase sigma factor [Streptomyces rubiginosohelvolus]|uniref:RNA polymerase sigma factor n=1 Tax=Streptomyces rubiginosohelvolus TaxID=67362 RepID=UPI0037F6E6FA
MSSDAGRNALAELYEQYAPWLAERARWKLAEHGIPDSVIGAEDLVQTAFLRVRDASAIKYPKAYLRRIVENEVTTIAERRDRWHIAETHRARLAEEATPDVACLVANRSAVHQHVSQLPLGQREAVWSHKALGYTIAETAEMLQKPPGTVAVHVARATRFLHRHLVAVYAALLVAVVAMLCGGVRRVNPVNGGPSQPPGWEDTRLHPFIQNMPWNGFTIAAAGLAIGEVIRRGWLLWMVGHIDRDSFRRLEKIINPQSVGRRLLDWASRTWRTVFAAIDPVHPISSPSRSIPSPRRVNVTPPTKPMYCRACDSDEPHRKLNSEEEEWLKKRCMRKSVEEFLLCLAPGCRRVRTFANTHPLAEPLHVPHLGSGTNP